MGERHNLPYTTQDLFPQAASPHSEPPLLTHPSFSFASPLSYYAAASRARVPRRATSLWRLFRPQSILRRLCKPASLDFETALWDIFHLVVNPRKMYRSHYFYRQLSPSSGRLSYTRDDPAFLLVLTALLSISAVAWGLAYSPRVRDIFKLVIYMVVVDFYVTGLVIASVSWYLTNRLFSDNFELGSDNYASSISYIEWGFCFDVHCNAFLVIWCLLYLLQFALMPLLRIKGSFLALVLGNTLYFALWGYYLVITFFGFSSLPVITNVKASGLKNNAAQRLQMILLAIVLPILAIMWVFTLLIRLNVAQVMVEAYFK